MYEFFDLFFFVYLVTKKFSKMSTTYTAAAASLGCLLLIVVYATTMHERETSNVLFRQYTAEPGVVVVGIFKNEAEGLAEWCNHYLKMQGVKHLYLIDNNSTDAWPAAIAPYQENVTVVSRPLAHAQVEHYNSFVPLLKEKHADDWVFVLDIDEYLYPSASGSTIASVVRKNPYFRTHSHISIRWKMFGSSGLVMQPASIRCAFTRRLDEDKGRHFWSRKKGLIKSGVAIRHLKRLDIHTHLYWDAWFTRVITPPASQRVRGEKNLKSALFQLNHYPIQSLDWFKRVKMTRGDSHCQWADDVRNADYFARYDHNDIEDKTLAERVCN